MRYRHNFKHGMMGKYLKHTHYHNGKRAQKKESVRMKNKDGTKPPRLPDDPDDWGWDLAERDVTAPEDETDGDDAFLWDFIARTVTPLGEAVQNPPPSRPFITRRRGDAPREQAVRPPAGVGLDAASARRLRRGQMDIDARLDLHGLNSVSAHEALKDFLHGAYARGARCVLVITGKGRAGGMGVLRTSLPLWLAEPPLSSIVLAAASAKPADGGGGAFYILLRRKRD